MPQRKQLTWAELRVGLFVLVGLAVLAAGIFYVTGAGILGPKYRIKTFLPEVSGLTKGASVKLDGVEIGNVEAIKFVPRVPGKPVDKLKNVEVDMRIDRRYQNEVLTDSVASLVTEGLLGNRYVEIKRGLTGLPLKENQEIPGAEEKAIKEVVERSAELLGNLTALSEDAQDMVAGVKNGRGTLGKLLTDEQAYNHLNSILAHGDQLVTGVQQGQGTLGKFVASDEMYGKVDKALDNVNGIISDVRAGKGTLGKLATDDTLYNKLRDTSSNLASATAKLNDNTTTAGKLFSDPRLYDNLTGLTGDLRLLIGDFRQNPKKFLRIKVALF